MGYTNNRTTAVHTKITNKGREKIATGNLNLAQWSIGDSEINYEREDYNFDNGITNSPARILKAVDMQPSIKYFIGDTSNNKKFDLKPNDIKVAKYTLSSKIENFGIYPFDTDDSEIIYNGIIFPDQIIDAKRFKLDANYHKDAPKVGDIVIIKSEIYFGVYRIENITNNIFGVDRQMVNVFTEGNEICIIPGSVVADVPMWNELDQVTYSQNGMEYENRNGVYNPAMDFNIITYEDVMGYFDKNTTTGYQMIGFMENYLSYNDDLNTVVTEGDPCAVDTVVGEKDKLQRFVGIVHYTNENRSNLFGDFFHIDHNRGKHLEFKLPRYVTYDNNIIRSNGEIKTIVDTDIEYYDMVVNNTNKVVGKVIPQLKMIVFDDHELITILSTASGRTISLPMINTELITSTNGILEAGKQMYVTYAVKSPLNSFPCQEYNVIKNSTTTAKDVKLLLPTNNDLLNRITLLDIVYQITDLGERPKKDEWKRVNVPFSANDRVDFMPINTKNLVIDNTFDGGATQFNLINWMNNTTPAQHNRFGNETVSLSQLNFFCGSNTYRSTITIDVNPNLMVNSSNPTYHQIRGVRPYITLSEIGIYDKDGDLVMISKITRPVTLTTNSTVRVEIGLDF